MKSIYLAGPRKGIGDSGAGFGRAERELTMAGWAVLNPAVLPEGLAPGAYMQICLAMVNAANAAVMLPGWTGSADARIAYSCAVTQGKRVYTEIGDVPFA